MEKFLIFEAEIHSRSFKVPQLFDWARIADIKKKFYKPSNNSDFHSRLDCHIQIFKRWRYVDVVIERHVLEFNQPLMSQREDENCEGNLITVVSTFTFEWPISRGFPRNQRFLFQFRVLQHALRVREELK
jgi:hypothetical protein